MRYNVAALALAAAGVSAQSLSDIPQCAIPCINDAVASATTCAADDYKCICNNSDALTGASTSCVLTACGEDTALNQVLPAVQKFCEAVLSGGGSTSAPASTPTSESTPAPTSESTAQSTAESTVASTSEPTGYPTEAPTSSSVSVPVTSQSSYPGTTLVSTAGGGNATATTPVTSVIPTAGAAVVGSVGGVAMMVLGALAAF
ncbi:hypothetical protein F5Y01DRAFT_286708 [Xylaria sp. FL0043]|nr:hypothetical protein F5Y01DRAFT_286708 [Xylaria sp. FL0043]